METKKRYTVEQDGPGYIVLDNNLQDGEDALVFGSMEQEECAIKAHTLNEEYYYTCPGCKTEWETGGDSDLIPEHMESDGCPDCLHECERCGTFIDSFGNIEHCL
jgi:hypothetical protein